MLRFYAVMLTLIWLGSTLAFYTKEPSNLKQST